MYKFLILCILFPIALRCQNNVYDIYALKFAERTYYIKLSDVAVGDKTGDSSKVYFSYWLLKGKNGKNILVDAGFTNDFEINPKMITWSPPEKLLENVNVKPEEITDIIVTHPHWDHMGGIDLYPNATVWLQEEDYNDLMAKQKDPESVGYNKKDVQKIKDRKTNGTLRIITMKGKRDQDILPGITVYTGSKHTPGSQFVMCNNGKQNVFLASDNCKYYRNIEKLLSSPYTSDQKAYVAKLRFMKLMVSDTDLIIPGHDPLVFEKFKTVAPNVVKIEK